jgi:uncharacterized membrane protein
MLTSFGLALAGLAVSIYLTIEHATANTTLACPHNSVLNCQKVTTGPQSVVLGVPVAVWGLGYFGAMAAATAPRAWRRAELDRVRVALAALGVVTVIYLIYVELYVVDAVCLWCSSVHLITLGLFAVVLLEFGGRGGRILAAPAGLPQRRTGAAPGGARTAAVSLSGAKRPQSSRSPARSAARAGRR